MKNSTFLICMTLPVAIMVTLSNWRASFSEMAPGVILILFMAGSAAMLSVLDGKRGGRK